MVHVQNLKNTQKTIKYIYCKDHIRVPSSKDGWTLVQKAQNNKFVESGLENRVRMSWAKNKVKSIDKNREVD